jgi:phosphate transport system substrate-binding protein
MWQQEKKDTSIIRLILWIALATTPMAATLLVSEPILAQSKPDSPAFTLPQTVQNGTTIRIDGSSNLSAINQSLKENFEKQYLGTKIETAANGTDAALKNLLDGKIDIVAMGRGLTPAEKAQGLEQVRLQREKIAIVVSADNPFKGSLTSRQFARIFRGQITNWSQLGGPSAKIRLIDHPSTSETRNTFRTYPAFKNAEFATGPDATQLNNENTAEIIKQLGKDGISYVLANQVSKLQNVRVLQLHQALPDDARYPFSQPLVYVYKKNPSVSIVDFLGFTLAPPGQKAIEQGRTAEAVAIATNITQPFVTSTPTAQTTPAVTASPSASAFGEQPFIAPATAQNSPIVNKEAPFWLLLPLFFTTVAGALLWWILGKRPSPSNKTDNLPESNPHPPIIEGGETAVLSASTASSVNGAILEEQPQPHFQEQETPDRTSFNIYAQTQSDLSQNGTQGTSNVVQEATNGTSNLYEGTTSAVANGSGAAALTDGAALATGMGAATWSAFTNKETETNATNQTVELNNYTDANSPNSDEVAWDIEAPAAVVNTSYPHLGNIPEETSEVTAPLPELPDVPEVTSNLGYWDTEISEDEIDEELQAELNWLESITSTEDTTSVDELPFPEYAGVESSPLPITSTEDTTSVDELPFPEYAGVESSPLPITSTEDIASVDELPFPEYAGVEPSPLATSSLLDLPELSEEDLFNVVADAAEPPINVVNEESQTEPTVGEGVAENDSIDFADVAALAAGAGIGAWAINLTSDTQGETDTTVDAEDQSSILLTPHTSTLAHVSWEISETQKAALRQQGGFQLVVRLYDVTGVDLSYQSPHLLQQYESEETAHDRLVEIPVSDRDYIAEIGYVADSNRWLFIARSAVVRFFSPVLPDAIVEDVAMPAAGCANADETNLDLLDEKESIIVLTPHTSTSAYVSWEISEAKKAALHQQGGSQLLVLLCDVTGIDLSYQSHQIVKQYESEETAHDGLVDIPVSDRDYIAEIGYVADGNRWLFIARSAVVRFFSPVLPDPIVDDIPITDETDINWDVEEEITEEESSIILTPRTSQWADVSWQISETKKAELQQQGGSQLVVRLYDATGIDLNYQSPQFVQQYECEETATDRFVEIPISDRDYIAEIGYVADGDSWLFIARSAIAHVFSPVHTDSPVEDVALASETAIAFEDVALASETAVDLVNVEEESKILLTARTPKWAYVSWHISQTQNEALQQQGGSQLVVRLYDVTGIDLSYQSPQLIQQYECEQVAHDRFVAIPVSDRDYMVEIGYVADSDGWLLIARSPNVRVFSRSHEDFWFVADAELIIHGATQPNTNVNISGHPVKVKPDGTFHLRFPFSDGLMDYLITVAADGESTKTIHKKFSQETSEN